MSNDHSSYNGPIHFHFGRFHSDFARACCNGPKQNEGCNSFLQQSGTSRIARFTNANPYPVRVEFSYQGTKTRGSGEASGEGAVLIAAEFFATYGAVGISITSVRIKVVMRGD